MDEPSASHHVYTHPSTVEHWRHLIEIIALIVAAVWGFYVFVYQERIKPANEAPNLDFHFDVHREYLIGNRELVKIVLVWRNVGSTEAQLDGFAENIYGATYGEFGTRLRDGSRHLFNDPRPSFPVVGQPAPAVKPVLESRAMRAHYSLIETWYKPWHPMGGPLYAHLLPGEQVSMPTEVVLPRNRFAGIVGVAAFCFRRGGDERTGIVRLARGRDGSFDIAALGKAELAAHLDGHCSYFTSGDYAL